MRRFKWMVEELRKSAFEKKGLEWKLYVALERRASGRNLVVWKRFIGKIHTITCLQDQWDGWDRFITDQKSIAISNAEKESHAVNLWTRCQCQNYDGSELSGNQVRKSGLCTWGLCTLELFKFVRWATFELISSGILVLASLSPL